MCFKVNLLQFFLRLQISEFVSYVFADIDGMQINVGSFTVYDQQKSKSVINN